jgi:UDP-N-acetyl-D-mannosaminuronic acid transferase (WecB/TagA/CpsF family)
VWVYEYRDELSMPVIAVGAAFDFHAGILPQAPGWIQNAGLEWLFRLMHEPRRLWRRYLYLNPYYLLMLAAQALRLKRFNDRTKCCSVREIRYG